jgi:hypothetical protein
VENYVTPSRNYTFPVAILFVDVDRLAVGYAAGIYATFVLSFAGRHPCRQKWKTTAGRGTILFESRNDPQSKAKPNIRGAHQESLSACPRYFSDIGNPFSSTLIPPRISFAGAYDSVPIWSTLFVCMVSISHATSYIMATTSDIPYQVQPHSLVPSFPIMPATS